MGRLFRVIMTEVSGTAEVVRDSEIGLPVPRRDARALADAIERLVSDAGPRRMGEAGHAYVEAHLSVCKIVPRLRARQAPRRNG